MAIECIVTLSDGEMLGAGAFVTDQAREHAMFNPTLPTLLHVVGRVSRKARGL